MYTINKITEISMDTLKQKSILDAVNKIVNPQPVQEPKDLVTELAETIELAMNEFESRFQFQLDEEQETILTDLAVEFVENPDQSETIDLNEDTDAIMEKYSPQQVFLSIFEDVGNQGYLARFLAAQQQQNSGGRRRRRMADDEDAEEVDQSGQPLPPSQDPTSTANVFSQNAQMHQQAMQQVQADPNARNITRYVNEEATQNQLKKHKKKVYKITFMDKGIKKKGTAVSHKGVMRIVSGKSHFKVYDERNRDVTSEFKSHGKKDKK